MATPKNKATAKHLIRLDDGFEGDVTQLAKHIGLSKSRTWELVNNHVPKIKGHSYEDLGLWKLINIIQVISDDEIFVGTAEEVAKHFFYSRSTVDCMVAKGAKLGGRDLSVVGRRWYKHEKQRQVQAN